MADALTPEDLASLATERGPVNMAVGGLLVFEAGPGVDYAAVVQRLEQRLHLIPRYRQRLEEAPLGLANPVWVDDHAFEAEWHVHSASLPDPGGDAELDAYVGRAMSRRLDRSRPLWELHVIDGLADGRAALLAKMHHALVDGLAAIDVGTVILDPSPEPMDIAGGGVPWEPRRYDRGRHLARLAASPVLRGQRLMLDTAQRALETSPRRAVDELRRGAELMAELTRQRPSAPDTTLNAGIGANRRYATVRARLDEIKAVGRAWGGTVNDVLLAAVTGMLGRALPHTDRPPVALIPVSVRTEEDRGRMGNRISTVFVDLPTRAAPPERVAAIAATTSELKDSAAVRAGALIAGASGWVPPAVSSVLVRAMGGVRAMNLVVSNVPGPQQPFFLNGSRLLEAYPAVPLNPAHQGLTVGILSYDGGVFFGLLADRDLEPPVGHLARGLEDALDELTDGAANA
ncbi:MAG TPA: wax ester/triacylglycerol synthase family O-acyltransferase [Solirubrobacteraceae bacterium]|nr:wax ester/triacylglycerol synthase family O-acyltransferase [Solirubrobacteraceae bacterium]